jgi:hypothetical protein
VPWPGVGKKTPTLLQLLVRLHSRHLEERDGKRSGGGVLAKAGGGVAAEESSQMCRSERGVREKEAGQAKKKLY